MRTHPALPPSRQANSEDRPYVGPGIPGIHAPSAVRMAQEPATRTFGNASQGLVGAATSLKPTRKSAVDTAASCAETGWSWRGERLSRIVRRTEAAMTPASVLGVDAGACAPASSWSHDMLLVAHPCRSGSPDQRTASCHHCRHASTRGHHRKLQLVGQARKPRALPRRRGRLLCSGRCRAADRRLRGARVPRRPAAAVPASHHRWAGRRCATVHGFCPDRSCSRPARWIRAQGPSTMCSIACRSWRCEPPCPACPSRMA